MKRLMMLAVATLAGCASSVPYAWHKSEATAADLNRDEKQCDHEAKSAAAAIADPFQRGRQIGELKDDCMEAREWVWQPAPSNPYGLGPVPAP